ICAGFSARTGEHSLSPDGSRSSSLSSPVGSHRSSHSSTLRSHSSSYSSTVGSHSSSHSSTVGSHSSSSSSGGIDASLPGREGSVLHSYSQIPRLVPVAPQQISDPRQFSSMKQESFSPPRLHPASAKRKTESENVNKKRVIIIGADARPLPRAVFQANEWVGVNAARAASTARSIAL